MSDENSRRFRRAGFSPEELLEEQAAERDRERLRSFCSARAERLWKLAEEECDRMDYPGSGMYDECPDRMMLRRAVRRVLERSRMQENAPKKRDVCPEAEDLACVLLCGEMYRRRLRRRKCADLR